MDCNIIFLFCFVVILSISSSIAEYRKEPYQYSTCQSGKQKRLGVQSGRIKDSAMVASTSKPKRRPYIGRLGDDNGAWSPSIQNAYQWLQIDMGDTYIVTAVYVQGRQGSDEYVREFFLEYSDDKKTWRVYTNQLGIPEVFEGNKDDSTPKMRELVYPIVTRYIRFNPQRWNMVISLRVEVVGCPFVPNTASFDGVSRVDFDMSQQAWQRTEDKLEMRFRTDRPNGVLLYASGTQGDLIMMELRRGYLYFKINLGSTLDDNGLTTVVAGSLLDDNQWHDVVIVREKQKLTVVVDRLLNELTTNGLFYRLDLDKKLYLGGVPFFNLEGITVKSNFYGCIQNVNFNGALLVKDAMKKSIASIEIVQNVNQYCNVNAKIPVTFPSIQSHLIINAQSGTVVHVSFDFRTYNADALLVFHEMDDDQTVEVTLDKDGHISYKFTIGEDIVEDVIRNTDVLSESTSFTDGLWHSFFLQADRNKINCTVDHNSKVSSRKLNFKASTKFFIGGHPDFIGFTGCMRSLYVAQKSIELLEVQSDNIFEAQVGTCSIRDRCTPNPCEHDGRCQQTWKTFTCDCENTGYKGELCHTSSYHISCEMHKQYSNVDGKEKTTLDPDGSGPMEPYVATCERNENEEIITYIGHDALGKVRVTGYPGPGSYVRKITYAAADFLELEEIIDRARHCRQLVKYTCHNSKLLSTDGLEQDETTIKRTWGWWVGRTFQPMRYWGGAAPGSGKCKCGLEEDNACGGKSKTCRCDAVSNTGGSQKTEVDQGYLVHKEYLPVLELHLGDTDSSGSKWAEHDIGELECFGDNLFDNTVTFDKRDGTLEFPTFEAQNAGDIWFQFKTTTSDGVLMHCTGDENVADFLEIRLFQADTIQFRYDVGNGVRVLSYRKPGPFNDDQWHTVHVEKNRKQAWLKIDDQKETTMNEDADLIRRLDLSKPLTVGALIGGQDGFVGCMRGLRVNGKLMDMMGKLRNGNIYGVKPGCIGKCASNPCFHQGTCREGYDRYTCDCSYTPWRGWNCGREVGVNLKENHMVKYTFDETQGLSASDFQFATIGFSTQKKRGILMQIRNEENTQYISVEMNNNGGIKVAMDVGFARQEENTDIELGVDYANNQVHVVTIRRYDFGRGLFFQVDNYPPFKKVFTEASIGSKTILEKPKYIFIGNNNTGNTMKGFEGCIFRMQVDNIFPLKRAFQDPKPAFIDLVPNNLREDMCGFEEITVSPEPIQTRPYKGVLQNVTYRRTTEEPLSDEEKALVGVGCALFVILVACIVLFCCRSRLEGADYETEEAAGAEFADNPDSAVVFNQTGLPNMPKSYEYFM